MAMSLGVASGVYIWKPLFEQTVGLDKVYEAEKASQLQEEVKKQE